MQSADAVGQTAVTTTSSLQAQSEHLNNELANKEAEINRLNHLLRDSDAEREKLSGYFFQFLD